ncbi:PDZ domain-containing protein [Xanthomonas fragariae]|uniref:M61 family metallopeptidase n=1 Tax=Xanthomonas fragariae TaxID=48664 RepID=UPI0022AA7637|nr:PDZ domain-containing protein [Xanthomonas fragariae]WAT13516.1 PDZ domain-containing protein [Xanthomonas fragariae]
MEVIYQVRLDPARQELAVAVDIVDPPSGPLTLATPTWVPGDYDFATYGRDVFDVKAVDHQTGAPIMVRRRGWSGYRVEANGRSVRIHYRASAASVDFGEACGVLGDLNGVLLGTRYLRVDAYDGPCTARYEIPSFWAIHHPSGATPMGDNAWTYDSYARLLDTPVAFGAFELLTRSVRGTPFYYLFLDRAVGFEGRAETFVDDLVKIAEVFHAIFGEFPFADYTFVMSFNPSNSWGLEHLSSTMVGLDPSTFYDDDQYKVSIRVCAHELFHAWNVRRLRPAPLEHLDLENGDFTQGLWVAEGFTRYYEFLSCARTGVYTPEQFLSAVMGYYTHLTALPAYTRVSPADASSATYLNHDKYPGRANSAIDYYDAGMVIAFELDAMLRMATRGLQSLDTVFASFYQAYAGQGAGYTVEMVCAFFDQHLQGLGELIRIKALEPARLDLPAQLSALGFSVDEGSLPLLGLILDDDAGPGVYSVLDGSPASTSGLAAEDVIVDVNGYPFSLEGLIWATAHETQVVLGILRGNQQRVCTATPGTRRTVTSLAWFGSPEQAEAIASWLHTPFSPAPGQEIPLDFYENFHGVETVI